MRQSVQTQSYRIDAGASALLHGGVELLVPGRAVAGQAHMDGVGAYRRRGEDGPVEDEVGCHGEQEPVLAAGRLAFHGVDDDHGAPTPFRDRTQFAGGGEASPAASGEPCRLGGLHQRRRAVGGEDRGDGRRPVALQMIGQGGRPPGGMPGRQKPEGGVVPHG